MPITPLTDYIEDTGNSKLFITDPNREGNEGWRQYILDHKDTIKNNSEFIMIDPNIFNYSKYDLKRFLKEKNIQPSLEWIIRLLNNNLTDIEFISQGGMYVPSESLISNTYLIYRTTSTTVNR